MRENASITTKRRSIEVRMTSRLRKTRRDEVVPIITTGGKIAEAMIAAITIASTAAVAVADIVDEDAEVTRINETLSEKNETQITKMSETSRKKRFLPS
jgi:hypothetical protein